jgi:hypothetical protein
MNLCHPNRKAPPYWNTSNPHEGGGSLVSDTSVGTLGSLGHPSHSHEIGPVNLSSIDLIMTRKSVFKKNSLYYSLKKDIELSRIDCKIFTPQMSG